MKKVITIFALVFASASYAQINQMEFIKYQYIRPGLHFKMWKFSEGAGLKRYMQAAAPITYSMALGPRIGIDVITSPYAAMIEQTDAAQLVNDLERRVFIYNMSDTFVRGSVLLGNDVALLTVGVGVPTGETNLSPKELAMAGLAANRPLNNPVTSFGAGPSVTLGIAAAQEFNSWVFGFGAGYALRKSYTAAFNNSNFDVKPGNEFNLTLGVEREFDMMDDRGKFVADFIYTNYGKDELNNQPYYEAGDKFLARGQAILPAGTFNPIILSITHRWRLDNNSNNATLIENGNELELKAVAYLHLSDSFSFKGIVQFQNYGNTVNEAEGASITGFGGGFRVDAGRNFTFDPSVVFLSGSINTGPNSEIDVTGIEAKGGFAFRF